METRDVFIPFNNSTRSAIGTNRWVFSGVLYLVYRSTSVWLKLTTTFSRLTKLKLPSGEHQLLLTKGDNNHVDDIELYQGLDWLERRHIVGKVRGYVSFISFPSHSLLFDPHLSCCTGLIVVMAHISLLVSHLPLMLELTLHP
jgi:signal peptidase